MFQRLLVRHRGRIGFVFFVLMLSLVTSVADAVTLYVSTDGNADWTGTLPEPNADQ